MATIENNKLEVRDLRISFRTMNGKVQAVRGINFNLKEGETLAIVGESGSGKSVTSKAILGILAGNAIIEGGEILYDRADLLKMPEDEFYKIRGDKIAMIFQDPLSSLNPIMRIGKQLTEAMILKGKARQKSSRKEFNTYLALIKQEMIDTLATENGVVDKQKAEELIKACKDFDTFEYEHLRLEKSDNEAFAACGEASADIENALFLIEKNAFNNPGESINSIVTRSLASKHTYVVKDEAPRLDELVNIIKKERSACISSKKFDALVEPLKELKGILDRAHAMTAPNYFTMAYYLIFSGNKEIPEFASVEEMNAFMRKYLDDNFMLDFIDKTKKALQHSAEKHYALKEEACRLLEANVGKLSDANVSDDELAKVVDLLGNAVKNAIDPLVIQRDVVAYTFKSSLDSAFKLYKTAITKNAAEEKRFAKDQAKYDKYVKKHNGQKPDWKVAPASMISLEDCKAEMVRISQRMLERYTEAIAIKGERNYDEEAVGVIDYLKMNAANVVNKVTQRMAKDRAIKLMEEVGISEPQKRFKQYPFEFSGGMRQRIVIAIALAADPDILICDEPTTALDVTIQAQILELINKLKKERNLSIIFITHDLGVVANMADKIAVMYAGKIVEYGTSEEIFYEPRHPYTWALLASMPDLDTQEKLEAIPGTPPNMIYPPKGDAFAARNKYALEIDFEEEPPLFEITPTHYAATWLLHPDAPEIDPPKIVTDRIRNMKKKAKEGK